MQASVEPSRRCLSGIMGLNDTAWENLFDKYHILAEIERNGQFTISANQIKEFREPRLMTKFDHKVNLPTIFAENQLAILPVLVAIMLSRHFQHTKSLSNRPQMFSEFQFQHTSKV